MAANNVKKLRIRSKVYGNVDITLDKEKFENLPKEATFFVKKQGGSNPEIVPFMTINGHEILLHQFLMESYGLRVRHKDNNKMNCRMKNLEIM